MIRRAADIDDMRDRASSGPKRSDLSIVSFTLQVLGCLANEMADAVSIF